MFQVKVHRHIERIAEVFYRIGFWHRQDEETVTQFRLKLFYSIYYFLFPVSLIAGAVASDNKEEFVFLAESSIMSAVLLAKLFYIIWRKKEIIEQLNHICEYDVEDRETFTQISDKLNSLMKFVAVFTSLIYFASSCIVLIVPFLGDEKQLFFNIGFPLDWRNNEFAYWMAFIFIFTQAIIFVSLTQFSVILWYFMANCGLRYVVLGQEIKDMGQVKAVDATAIKISNAQRDYLYQRDLIEAITSHQHLEELTNHLHSFLSDVFVVQLITSALCICTAIYCLAFYRSESLIENVIYLASLLYNIFDIFMVMYFGNELELSSGRLTYCLFESNWVDRTESIKKNVLIFGEFLMQPHQLVVLKLYPLNLETFTRILNSAYSMFNILQNLK